MQKDYSVLRGPCPEGFHVPTHSEALIFQNIRDDAYVKMNGSIGQIHEDGIYTPEISDYWTSTMGSYNHPYYIWRRYADSFYIVDSESERYSDGYNYYGRKIRPFKDTPVIPDNTWTMLYDNSSTATGAGIFWNEGAGLISISFDGVNRTTIADKDLGATTVGGMGLMYQRGNNHGWAYNDTISTISTLPNLSGYGPMNKYNSSYFVTGSSQEFLVNHNLWGYETFRNQYNDIYVGEGPYDYSAMRGPCPKGFHIPLENEWGSVLSMIGNLGLDKGSALKQYLHVPATGYYNYYGGSVSGDGEYGYRCSNVTYQGCIIMAGDNRSNPSLSQTNFNCGYNIRHFADVPSIPDNTWTTVYDGTSAASGAGIFWDQINGLISISSDGINWKTIADKNLGATEVWNPGDNLTNKRGKYYQRGNCYGFSSGFTTSSTQVDASNYGPGNYFYGDKFIYIQDVPTTRWDSSYNDNLRGGETGRIGNYNHLEIYVGDGIPKSSFRGPCPYGFHVPTGNEWGIVTNIMNHLFPINEYYTSTHPDYYKQYLHMPIPGDLGGDGQRTGDDEGIMYWASTPDDNPPGYAETIYLNNLNGDRSSVYTNSYYRGRGFPIRPFKNEPITLDDSYSYRRSLIRESGSFRLYENSRDGFLSLTDGETWITMTDKNLGATAVYNSGDTLTQDNCCGFFQWGNNYMFPFSGATTTSASQVDATGYGPLNPYSSSTFVELYNNRTDWANPANDNLWGGTTQLIQNVAEVYKGTTLVRSNYQPTTPTAGIYWCPTKKCISISANGTDWMTMSDRNLGAANPGDVGLLYQRGNNYGFPPQRLTTVSTDSTQIDVSSYGPNNYYYSDIYITNNLWRSNGDVRDLRGGVTFTDESVRGPCGEGWHIPSRGDWQYSINWAKQLISDYNTIRDAFKLGEGRYRDNAGDSKCCYYAVRCCEATYYSSSQKTYPYLLRAPGEHTSPVINISQSMTNYAHPIRPFKNEPVIPDDTSRIKLT